MMQFDQAIKFLEMVCNDLLPKIEEESARSAAKLLMVQAFDSIKAGRLKEEPKDVGEG